MANQLRVLGISNCRVGQDVIAHRQEEAEGLRIIWIAFKEAPRTMFPANSGVGGEDPDRLTFDLAEDSRVSLWSYGKRPGPGCGWRSFHAFSTQETDGGRRPSRPTSG